MNVDMQTENNKNSESNQTKDQTAPDGAATAGASAAKSDEGADLQEEKIRHLEEEVQVAKDRYLRTLAEMDNMRRRQERERQDLLKYASEKLLQDLLPVLDSFEKASSVAGAEAGSGMVEGIRMVHKQLTHVLENNGLKAVEAVGKPFDPNLHQAIQRLDADSVDQETVKDEYQRGYTLNGRLIRPTMVSVLVPKSGPS
jgi:molecular chaperone GrpE